MRRPNRLSPPALAALFVLAVTQQALATEGTWLHLRVTEADGAEAVNLNVPLSLAEAMLDLAGEATIHAEVSSSLPQGMSVAELRRVWSDLKSAGDSDFLTVDGERESVRFALVGDLLSVKVRDTAGSLEERVDLEVPVALVDALLGQEGDQLDLRGALRALAAGGIGDVLTVRDGAEVVRLWVE